MLESNKESLKLEAMKRIVGVSAWWENDSDLLPWQEDVMQTVGAVLLCVAIVLS